MARPPKQGLDYFALDVDMANDKRIQYISGMFGLEGFAVTIHLLMAIYRNGYYLPWDDIELYSTGARINCKVNVLSEIVNQLVNVGFFDINLYQEYGILTSHGIQSRYIRACEYRKSIVLIKDYCLLNDDDVTDNSRVKLIKLTNRVNKEVNSDTCGVKQGLNRRETISPNELNGSLIPQSKVNKSKVKNSSININNSTKYINSGDVVDNSQDVVDNSTEHTQDEILGKVFQAYESNIHPVATPVEQDRIAELYSEFGGEWLLKAIEVAALNRGKTVRYIEAILHKWGTMPCGTVPWENAKPPDKKSSRVEQNLQAAQKAIEFFENGGGSL